MRRLHLLILLLVVPSVWLLARTARAQEPGPEIVFSRHRQFRIPFQPTLNEQRIRELKLFVSADQGHKWEQVAAAHPEHRHFSYVSQADGLYWFTVQTIDVDGRAFPAVIEGTQPSLKVLIDTVPPIVTLKPLPPRAGEVGVTWKILDEYPGTIQLDYRPVGGAVWTPLVPRPESAQLYWSPETNATLEVRLRATDRAGNVGAGTTNVSLGPGGAVSGTGGAAQAAADPGRRLINSKTISLNYEIKDKGPSGISSLELWFTRDGRSWNKYPLAKGTKEQALLSPLVFSVSEEGVYGFTLVARSGVGLGERPPQIGDRPQVWVEVDLTKPEVQVGSVIVGQGMDKGKLAIAWRAWDKNLSGTPIALSYAQQAAGPWTPITPERIANTGRYIWSMPDGIPYQFLVKVEAVDQAGNVGEAVTPEMIKVDLLQPKARILEVSPGSR